MKKVLIFKNTIVLLWTSLFQFLRLFFLYGINGNLNLLFFPCVHICTNYSFTENIVVIKIELCYFVCFVKPSFPRKKERCQWHFFHCFFFFLLLSDQYAFCRYMIDIFAHGDLKPGIQTVLLFVSFNSLFLRLSVFYVLNCYAHF